MTGRQMNLDVKKVRKKKRRKKQSPSILPIFVQWLVLLYVFPTVTKGIVENDFRDGVPPGTSRSLLFTEEITHNAKVNMQFSRGRHRQLKQRNLDHHKRNYYQFLDDDVRSRRNTTSLSDVWLCLSCALGWTIYLAHTRQPPQLLVFEQRDSSKAMGHVLQVSLGEDDLGTGIPVYYALVDYVVEGESDEDHIQVRKVFTSKKLLEEGFANIEVLYLTDDPTTAILMEDFLDQKKERESQSPPSSVYFVVIYSVAALLIGTSIFGAILAIHRLDDDLELYGWISLAVGVVLLYPCARLLYQSASYVLASFSERPGVILRGKRLYWTKQCHGVNPFEMFNNDDDGKDLERNSVELSELQVPTIDLTTKGKNSGITPQNLLFPNAGCGFGKFNVHLPSSEGRPRTSSSVSSMSASASASQNSTDKNCSGCRIARNDTSIFEKYEMHVSTSEKNSKHALKN